MKNGLFLVMASTLAAGCVSDANDRMTPPPWVVGGPDSVTSTPGGDSSPEQQEVYVRCPLDKSERIATLSIETLDGHRAGHFVFPMCRARTGAAAANLPGEGQAGDGIGTGAGYNAVASVTAATDNEVTVKFDADWTDGSGRNASGKGQLTARLAALAEEESQGGLSFELRYHYGQSSNRMNPSAGGGLAADSRPRSHAAA